ncbi:glycoside hydrolase family 15 protein [Serendipita vermifera]|nr:glycoside hydrolase family 15 protein [Serendipita vermifera]
MSNKNDIRERGYVDISDHGLIGNLRTAALVSLDGSIESYCVPYFDSPSVFARILDKDKGGHFSITPTNEFTPKQAYQPSSNVLSTKFLSDCGVGVVTDFLPRQSKPSLTKPNLPWLMRRVEVIRGKVPFRLECAPAFDYARAPHTMEFVVDDSIPNQAQKKILFKSKDLNLDLRYVTASSLDDIKPPEVVFEVMDLQGKGHLGPSVSVNLDLHEGQIVTFILRTPPEERPIPQAIPKLSTAEEYHVSFDGTYFGHWNISSTYTVQAIIEGANKLRSRDDPILTTKLVDGLLKDTNDYWQSWIGKSTYVGYWREAVHRSALALKLLIFEPTGAIVASPTFSLPEFIGGTRNWDYRYSWVRDSSFTLYALIRLGFTDEANAFMDFIFKRIQDRNEDGSLQIMYTIHGEKDMEELELTHLSGHKNSGPVRIGNGAATHVQLDIYGELLDFVYLSQKFARPLGYDMWVAVRDLVDYVVKNCHRPDLSIWEVRNKERHFTYSKIMMWVAIDRGLRLAEKRQLPLGGRRQKWLDARDALYEEIQEKSWSPKRGIYGQSWDEPDILDSAVLVAPLVFFCPASDPRFLSTLKEVLKSPERGGLSANSLVYRYDTKLSDDGVGGEEGFFSLCTLWCIEALTRAGEYDPPLLQQAVKMFEDFLGYSNHVGLFTEEVSVAGEGLGNAVQGFTHVTLISTAFHLSRSLKGAHA